MSVPNFPAGLHWLLNYIRVDGTTWTGATRTIILNEMKRVSRNIKPVFVVQANLKVDMFIANTGLTALTPTIPAGVEVTWQRENEQAASWMKEKTRIQKDTGLTRAQKESQIDSLPRP